MEPSLITHCSGRICQEAGVRAPWNPQELGGSFRECKGQSGCVLFSDPGLRVEKWGSKLGKQIGENWAANLKVLKRCAPENGGDPFRNISEIFMLRSKCWKNIWGKVGEFANVMILVPLSIAEVVQEIKENLQVISNKYYLGKSQHVKHRKLWKCVFRYV